MASVREVYSEGDGRCVTSGVRFHVKLLWFRSAHDGLLYQGNLSITTHLHNPSASVHKLGMF